MAHCCAIGCTNSHKKNIRMFSFPRETSRRSIWEKNVNREEGWRCNTSRICVHHFKEEFLIRSDNNIFLEKDAVPTIFSENVIKPVKFNISKSEALNLDERARESTSNSYIQEHKQQGEIDFNEYIEKSIDFHFNTPQESHQDDDFFDPENFFTVDFECVDDDKRKFDELSVSVDSLKLDCKKSKPADLSQASISSTAVSESSNSKIESSISISDISTTITTTGTNEELKSTVKKLKLKLKEYKRKLKKICVRNINTIKKYKAAVKRFSRTEKKKKELKGSDVILKRVFNDDQVEALERNSTRGMEWSNETIELGLKFKFSCGSTGYDLLLKNNIPLPSISTLNRRLENLKFDTGILHEVMEFLSKKVKNMVESEKDCCLLIDEMKIAECREFDQANNKFFGDITFPVNKNVRASDAFVFQLGGISSRWKQVIAYEFTGKKMGENDGEILKSTILTIIQKCESLGLKVHSVTSDMGGNYSFLSICYVFNII